MSSPSFSLVLSGGGLKGLAHIGVLRALAERNMVPTAVVGCSMGSLIAAAWAAEVSIAEMEDRALAVRRKDIFRVAHVDMALKRMLSPAVYRREPLDTLIHSLVGDRTFRQLNRRLIVNTADLETGQQVLWGLPGFEDAPVADAVFASCSLPGLLPPRTVLGRTCVDGAVVENLPARAGLAAVRAPVIAVDVSGQGTLRRGRRPNRLRLDLRTRSRDCHAVAGVRQPQGLGGGPSGAGAAKAGATVDVRIQSDSVPDRGGLPRHP